MSAGPDRRAAAARGFTLIELVVTIALVAILMSLAAPNFVAFQRNSQLTSTANSFLAAMASARAEAMKSNMNAFVMPNTPANNPASTCTTTGWTCGWFVFVDVSTPTVPRNNTWDSATEPQLLVQEKLPASITTPANSGVNQFSGATGQYVLYNGSGFPRLIGGGFAAQSIDFSNGGTGVYGAATRRVISTPTGRMYVCTPQSASDLTCSATSQ